jgi:hypothetical protein
MQLLLSSKRLRKIFFWILPFCANIAVGNKPVSSFLSSTAYQFLSFHSTYFVSNFQHLKKIGF